MHRRRRDNLQKGRRAAGDLPDRPALGRIRRLACGSLVSATDPASPNSTGALPMIIRAWSGGTDGTSSSPGCSTGWTRHVGAGGALRRSGEVFRRAHKRMHARGDGSLGNPELCAECLSRAANLRRTLHAIAPKSSLDRLASDHSLHEAAQSVRQGVVLDILRGSFATLACHPRLPQSARHVFARGSSIFWLATRTGGRGWPSPCPVAGSPWLD